MNLNFPEGSQLLAPNNQDVSGSGHSMSDSRPRESIKAVVRCMAARLDSTYATNYRSVSNISQLNSVGDVLPVRKYIQAIWRHREFATYLPINNLRTQNRDTILGNLWHLANPAMQIAIYYVIFGVILKTTGGTVNYFGFLTVGIFTFTYTQKVVMESSTAMTRNEGVIRSVYFPRAVLPLSSAIGQAIAYIPSIIVMLVALPITGTSPSLRWLVFPVAVFVQSILNLGFGLFIARAAYHMRDFTQLLPHVFRLLLYFSGVLFSIEDKIDNSIIESLFNLNPLYSTIEFNRWCLTADPISLATVISALAWPVVALVVGFVYFRRSENRYGG